MSPGQQKALVSLLDRKKDRILRSILRALLALWYSIFTFKSRVMQKGTYKSEDLVRGTVKSVGDK